MIIGIYNPETDEEKISGNLVRRVKKLGITYPALLDQKGANWARWEQSFWPTVYLIDKNGRARYRWAGELEYEHAGGGEIMASYVQKPIEEK